MSVVRLTVSKYPLILFLGGKSKASAFFTEIKDFAVETPLMLDDLSKGAQMMLGFGVDSERVIPILKANR